MSTERLYHLLPPIYRQRDAEQGEPLRALLQVIEREALTLQDDIEGLYDNWFIETCAEWVVPYIGDLLGVPPLIATPSAGLSARPYVANTLAYRRRKGTPAVLQQLARDVSGWPARAVEFFQLLATTQYINHLRLFNHRTPDLRDANALELLGGPFESATHTVDVRRIAPRLGKYNIPNIGVYVWRLQSYPIQRSDARAVAAPGGFTFNPLGLSAPLFNRPQTEAVLSPAVEEINVPAPLRRLPLYFDLQARRKAIAESRAYDTLYFGESPVFELFLDGSQEAIDPKMIAICNLETWRRPPGGLTAAIDPVLGRLSLSQSVATTDVRVNYSNGFNADVGGGPYNRFDSASSALAGTVTWQRGVSRSVPPIAGEIVGSLSEAIDQWNLQVPGTIGVIAVLDSRTYDTGGTAIRIPEGNQLLIVAADWPMSQVPGDLPPQRLPGQFVPDGCRPHLLGDLQVSGAGAGGTLVLNGLLVEGMVRVLGGDLGALRISHCTLAPIPVGAGDQTQRGLSVVTGNSQLEITLDHVISGIVSLKSPIAMMTVADSIIDAADVRDSSGHLVAAASRLAIDSASSACSLERCTVMGGVSARRLDASNSIFSGRVGVERRQQGCVRFSNLSAASRTSRQFRCVTSQATAFTSTRYGDPGYAQLAQSTSDLIRTGADDGSEMGVFSSLQEPQRRANLQSSLEQYLGVSLEAGIYYAT